MKKRFLVVTLAVMLAVILASPLAAGKRKHPSKLKYKPLEITTPEVIDIELDGGAEGFLIEDHEIPVVNGIILIKTYFPEPGKYGLNEMAQWVIRNGGSQNWPADELNDELEFLASFVEVGGGDLSTSISFNCLKKDLDRVLEIFADLIMHPAFPEDKIEMKRGKMLEDIRRKNDQPSTIVVREFSKIVFGGHPFGLDTSAETVEAITRDDLIAFHGKYFHPNNAIVGISGDVTRDEIIGKLNAALAGWEPADVDLPPVPEIGDDFKPGYYYAYKDISQAYISLGHLGINANNPDRCAVNIMNFILGGGSFTSWITDEVREKKGLAYSTGSEFTSNAWAKGTFRAYAQTKLEEYSRALQLIQELVQKMRTEGPTEEEVKNAVDFYLNGQVFDYESKSAVMQQLVNLKFQGRPLDTPERDMEIYAKLSAADIVRVANKYLLPDKFTILVIGDAEKFDRQLTEFGEVTEIELEVE